MIKFFSAIGLAIILMLPIALIDSVCDIDTDRKVNMLTTLLITYSFIISIIFIFFVV